VDDDETPIAQLRRRIVGWRRQLTPSGQRSNKAVTQVRSAAAPLASRANASTTAMLQLVRLLRERAASDATIT
jgi:hypothetical protein